MKRILKLLLPFLMAFALCLPVLAEEQRVFDNAGLLDEWEVSMLEDKIQDLRDTYDMDVVLLTLNSWTARPPRVMPTIITTATASGKTECFSCWTWKVAPGIC